MKVLTNVREIETEKKKVGSEVNAIKDTNLNIHVCVSNIRSSSETHEQR